MTDDIVAFIQARLDEDEAAAKVFDWAQPDTYETDNMAASPEYITVYVSPARVLRGVDAKRGIVARYVLLATQPSATFAMSAKTRALEGALQMLACEWSDHPDYRQEWKP